MPSDNQICNHENFLVSLTLDHVNKSVWHNIRLLPRSYDRFYTYNYILISARNSENGRVENTALSQLHIIKCSFVRSNNPSCQKNVSFVITDLNSNCTQISKSYLRVPSSQPKTAQVHFLLRCYALLLVTW